MRKQRDRRKKRLILGITGGYGTGKSTVAGFFRQAGARVIDADKIAHDLLETGTGVYTEVIKYFGKGILQKDKSIDRSKLAEIVFTRAQDIKRLNRIMHPEIKRVIKNELKQSRNEIFPPPRRHQNDRVAPCHSDAADPCHSEAQPKNLVVVLDAPLLFETGLDKLVDKVVAVKTTKKKQFERLLKQIPRLSKPQILSRINAQMPLSEKVRRADFIIDNNETVEQTRKQAESILSKISVGTGLCACPYKPNRRKLWRN